MTTNELIDRFVETVNSRPRERIPADEVPSRLRAKEVESDWCDWQIIRSEDITWIDELESRLPAKFPDTYSAFVRNYEFPAFDIGGLMLLSNTREGTCSELRTTIFADEHMSPFLLRHGLIQFARPDTGDYDPICFDTRKRAHRNEFPVVRIDHESILCHDRLKIVQDVGKSFYSFIRSIIGAI